MCASSWPLRWEFNSPATARIASACRAFASGKGTDRSSGFCCNVGGPRGSLLLLVPRQGAPETPIFPEGVHHHWRCTPTCCRELYRWIERKSCGAWTFLPSQCSTSILAVRIAARGGVFHEPPLSGRRSRVSAYCQQSPAAKCTPCFLGAAIPPDIAAAPRPPPVRTDLSPSAPGCAVSGHAH